MCTIKLKMCKTRLGTHLLYFWVFYYSENNKLLFRKWDILLREDRCNLYVYNGKESLLTAIDRKKIELDFRRPLTEGELERLTEEFVVEYTYNSNAIEGNTLTLRETDMVLRGLTIDRKPLKDHMEAVGHKEAFDFVRDLVKGQVPLSESIIKQIHCLVLADKREDRGVYRRVPVRIMGAKHEPVQPYLIQLKMEQLLQAYRNSIEHIIPRLARFHIEFEGIHPFIDAHVIIGTRLEKPSKINGFALLSPNFFMPERENGITSLLHILLASSMKV